MKSLAVLGLDTLFRTGLASTDQQFLPSCVDRADYLKQTNQQAPDDDPTQDYRYFWDKSAAKLPPTQPVVILIWNGSAMTPVAIPAGQLAVPNLPGVQLYPPYTVPVTDSMWTETPGFQPNTFPSSWLSQDADSKALLALFPGSKLQTGQECFPRAVFQLDPAYPDWKATVLVMSNGIQTFAGGLVLAMNGPNLVNGGGRGNPGSFDANGGWVPKPHPNGQSVSTIGTPCKPVPAGYTIQRVPNGVTFLYQLVPDGGATQTASGMIGDKKYTLTLEN